jgi:hypothetical protein
MKRRVPKEKTIRFARQATFIERAPYYGRTPGYWVELIKKGKMYIVVLGSEKARGPIKTEVFDYKENAERRFEELMEEYDMYEE